ncbi:hypothetical protein SASPL_100314 [Salvia splendens]|uniref:AIG1-type G domain-containing protein n=1 Tax=Salvia splendens TaxID=180675 RepID=A0A8X8YSN3_SALSN|nr:translocase of chloroplast 159, chloroplastic-like [Salvia splendens]KAG6435440.1 hypothetical protein SASPL_100314 [Salvia splendens]
MGSSIQGVPLSGIRAPLTLDDSDIESSFSSKSGSYYSDSELENVEGDGDMLEVGGGVEEDEGLVEETEVVSEFAASGGAVVGLSGEVVESSSSKERRFVQESGDFDDSGSLLSESNNDELVGKSKNGANSSIFRPMVAESDEGVEEVGEVEVTPVMGPRVLSARKLAVPVAKISGDSDDDSYGSVVSDEEGFYAGVARVPSIEVLHRIGSAPIVRILEDDDEGNENESQGENVVDMELDGNLLDEMEHSLVKDSDALDFNEETMAHLLDVDEEFNPMAESRHDGELIHLDEDIKEVDVVEERKECLELVGSREDADFAESIVLHDVSCVASVEEAAGSNTGLEDNYIINQESLELVGSRKLADFANSMVLHDVSCLTLVDEAAGSNIGLELEDNYIFNQNYESENVEGMKQGIEQTVESSCFDADHEISSPHRCVDINEDASSICAVAASQSVFEGSKLDEEEEEETGKEVEASEVLPSDVEELSFYLDISKAEMDVTQDSTTPNTGGVLLDHSEEIDSEVLVDFHDEVDVGSGMSNEIHTIDAAALFEDINSAALGDDDDLIKVASVYGVENSSLGTFDSARTSIAAETHGMSNETHTIDPAALFEDVKSAASGDDGVENLSLGTFDSARTSIAAETHGVNPSSTIGEDLSEREKMSIKKIQKIRAKYLCLLERLGHSPEDSVALKFLYQLTLAAGSSHLDSCKNAAMENEAQTKDSPDFPLTVLIIGKTGVGKSATVNSIMGENTAAVDAFEPATARVREIAGLINGVKLRIFDTPGLSTCLTDQSSNRKILSSIKKVMRKCPPDVVLYVDRLDTRRGGHDDLSLLRLVTSSLGSSIWRKSIVAFTHGAATPPDGPDGCPISYEVFLSEQSQVVQSLICRSAGEPEPLVMTPVCVIENAEKNGDGEKVLHSGWRAQLLLLCCSMKIISEVGARSPLGLLSHLPPKSPDLSPFLKSNVHPGLSSGQSGDIVGSDAELCDPSGSNQDVDVEHDNPFPFKPLDSSQTTTELSRDQWEAYGDGEDQDSMACLFTRPVLTPHGWDHGCSYEYLLIEDRIKTANAMISALLTEDRKELKIQLHSSVGKRATVVGNTGIIQSEDDAAYGATLFFNQDEGTVGISAMRWGDELIYGCNLHSCIRISMESNLDITAALNSRLRGKICMKTSCSNQLQIAALALVPIAIAAVKKLFRQIDG